jgi:hypothetical protein
LLAAGLHADKAAGAPFAATAGDVAFQTDGTLVNTGAGGRAMRLGVVAKREPGQPATADQGDARRLPAPPARVLFAGSETAEPFGPRLRRWAGRLGLRDPAAVWGRAEGAEWIGKQAAGQLPGAKGLLDIGHAGAPLCGCAQVLYGAGAAEVPAWVGAGRPALRTAGAAGVQAHRAAARAGGRSAAKRGALDAAARYFGRRTDYLD